MPAKKSVFTPATETAAAVRQVLFTMDKPTNAPEGFVPEVFTFDLTKISAEMLERLALHGASQKIGDSYAGAKDSGEDPLAYAKAAIQDTIKQLYSKENGGNDTWSVARSGSGAPRTSILIQAYAQVKGVSIEDAQETIGALNDDEKKVVAGTKKVAAAMAQIRAEAAAAKARKLAAEAAKEDEEGGEEEATEENTAPVQA
jgi:hypothetical protein